MKETYNVKLIEKQFRSVCSVMETVLTTTSSATMEGPIRIALTHGKQTMTLTMSKDDS